ncbi:MAG: aminotransferase class I/II-fold pyridoxal phosphate-dependent enzyme [Candidatus Eremiobacteraeota bacterium]|nr:aminotransferase class I/II-fold pyridoxal phosphate-dependent enzyme [Candidatus Eremiobacteraeota bacterium]
MIGTRRAAFLLFSRPVIEDDEIAEVVDCLKSGWITSGPRVARFEEMVRERVGAAHAVAVNSATAGLHIALHALGAGPGDEVVVPSITWASTANAVELLGARAVLADVDPRTLQLDPADVARRLTPRTRAVIPVHYAGAPADTDAIRAAVAGRSVTVIEDAAHAIGTSYRGRAVGGGGAIAVFSFHPIKNITTGEGGMVVCHDAALAERLRLLRFHGVSKDAWKRYARGGTPQYEVVEPGYKYNMLDIQAALGVVQLPKLDRFIAARRALAERYDDLLADLPGVRPIDRVDYPSEHAWHLYVVRLRLEALAADRDTIIGDLAEENVGAGLHFTALHRHAYYREKYGYAPGDLPHASAASDEILSLPLYPGLTAADQDDVVRALRAVLLRRAA